MEIIYFVTLVQIRFLKTLYFGQHNADGTLIDPITPWKYPISRGFTGTKPILCRINLDSIMSRSKKEKGTLVLKTIKSCPKC
jgi:hypothetical protein